MNLYCAFGDIEDPIVNDWWEARFPEYEDSLGTKQLRESALANAKELLAEAVR